MSKETPGNVILCQLHRTVGVNGLAQLGAADGVYPFYTLVTGEIYFFRQIHVILFDAANAFVFIAYHVAVAVVEVFVIRTAVMTAVVLEILIQLDINRYILFR